ncbi:hypothetical protein MRX96_020510 [Rhipicephalus microplus]
MLLLFGVERTPTALRKHAGAVRPGDPVNPITGPDSVADASGLTITATSDFICNPLARPFGDLQIHTYGRAVPRSATRKDACRSGVLWPPPRTTYRGGRNGTDASGVAVLYFPVAALAASLALFPSAARRDHQSAPVATREHVCTTASSAHKPCSGIEGDMCAAVSAQSTGLPLMNIHVRALGEPAAPAIATKYPALKARLGQK